ncbi:MAG: DUF4446 family protein [Lachnospiraceae bacterium]|jgi:hypothetical protein
MSNLISALNEMTGVLNVLLIVVVLILLLVVMNLSIGFSRLTRKYNMFMKGKDAQSLERMFVRKLAEIDRLIETNEIYNIEIKKIKNSTEKTLNKYGIVKYDAFEDMGGKLSFVLAMLDKDNSGFILNAIHSRENCFLYIKEIVKGESYIMLSEEEVEALRQAVTFGMEEEVDNLEENF